MCAASVKQAKRTVRWSAAAQRALDQTMAHVNAQDYSTGLLVLQRVTKVIDLLSTQPDIGTRRICQRYAAIRFPKLDTPSSIV